MRCSVEFEIDTTEYGTRLLGLDFEVPTAFIDTQEGFDGYWPWLCSHATQQLITEVRKHTARKEAR